MNFNKTISFNKCLNTENWFLHPQGMSTVERVGSLQDGDCESGSQKALPPLQDYLDELLIPGESSETQEAWQEGPAENLALENLPPAAAETMAIVLYQILG